MNIWLDYLAAAAAISFGFAAGSLLTAAAVGGIAWRYRRRALRAEVLLAGWRARRRRWRRTQPAAGTAPPTSTCCCRSGKPASRTVRRENPSAWGRAGAGAGYWPLDPGSRPPHAREVAGFCGATPRESKKAGQTHRRQLMPVLAGGTRGSR